NAGVEQTQSAGKVGRESLIFFKFYHIHADRLDDFFSSHAGAGSHHKTAEQHQPDGNHHSGHIILAVGESYGQKEHTDKFLSILGTVHEAHGSSSKDLSVFEKEICLSPVHSLTD